MRHLNYFLIVIFCFSSLFINAQEEVIVKEEVEDEIHYFVQEQPSFAGGEEALYRFLADNINYPKKSRQLGIQGTVYTKFIVEKDGRVTNLKIVRGVSPEIDNETRRVIGLMPKWNPAKQGGEIVRCQFSLPVKYMMMYSD